MKKILVFLLAFFVLLFNFFWQNMQSSNLIKTPLANAPNEDVAILKNAVMYEEGNAYSGGQVHKHQLGQLYDY